MNVEASLIVDAVEGARLLRQNDALVVRRALPVEMIRAYGRAWLALASEYREASNAHFRRVHDVAGLDRYALVTALAQSPIIETLRTYYGITDLPCIWNLLVSAFGMEAAHPERAVPFHQDGGAGGQPYVRAWTLIHPESVADIAPGLALLPTRGRGVLSIDPNPVSLDFYRGLETSHDTVREIEATQPAWTPIVRLGDAVLFTGDCLHASYFPPGATVDRLALQITFCAVPPAERHCIFRPDGVQFPTDDGSGFEMVAA